MSIVSGRQEATVRNRMMTAPPRTSTFQKIDFHTPPLCEKPFTMTQMLICSKLNHCEGLFFSCYKNHRKTDIVDSVYTLDYNIPCCQEVQNDAAGCRHQTVISQQSHSL